MLLPFCVRGLPLSTYTEIYGIMDPLPPVRKITEPPLLISSTMSAFGPPPVWTYLMEAPNCAITDPLTGAPFLT